MHCSSVRGSVVSSRSFAVMAFAAMASIVSGCSSVGDTGGTAATTASGGASPSPVANAIFGGPSGATENAIVVSAENFGDTVDTCPPISIRPGTESMQVFAAGKKPDPVTGELPPIQFQASIVKTARECHKTAGGVAVKVGVLGRVVAGPAGKAGPVTLPVRVAVVQGNDKILKSDLYRIQVSLQEPDLAADFTKIDQSIEVPMSPGNTDFRIYVGFDDSPLKGAKGKRG